MRARRTTLQVALGLSLAASSLPAQDIVLEGQNARATLVELYSSEGCSSCPPAEKWVSQLKTNPRLWKQIVPVVFHVDYWDGLGWPDRFARKSYTQRQSDYQSRWNASSVYTPEFIVNGHEWHAWFDGGALPFVMTDPVGPLRVVIHRDTWGVKVTHAPVGSTISPHLTVNVAWLGMEIASAVRGGENDGRKLIHDFVVLDFQSKPASLTSEKRIFSEFSGPVLNSVQDQPAAIAVWLSREDGTIFQATGGSLE